MFCEREILQVLIIIQQNDKSTQEYQVDVFVVAAVDGVVVAVVGRMVFVTNIPQTTTTPSIATTETSTWWYHTPRC